MALLKKILFVVIGLVLLLVVGGFLLPGAAHVERSATIDAPLCTVQAQLDNFRRFNDWSPWAEKDPAAKYTFEGPARGVGAKMSWTSDDPNVGSGSQEIKRVEPGLVEVELDFGEQGTAESFYRLEEEGEATAVTWGFDTDFGLNLIGRYLGLFFDRWVGADYEAGLANLKAMAEELPDTDWCDLEVEMVDTEAMTYAYASGSSGTSPEEVGAALGEAYGQVMAFLGQRRLSQTGPPLAVANSWDESGYSFDAGVPVTAPAEMKLPPDSLVKLGKTHAGLAVRAVHRGPYEGLNETAEKLRAYLEVHGLEPAGRPWDVFVSDPGSTPPEELETHMYIPLAGA